MMINGSVSIAILVYWEYFPIQTKQETIGNTIHSPISPSVFNLSPNMCSKNRSITILNTPGFWSQWSVSSRSAQRSAGRWPCCPSFQWRARGWWWSSSRSSSISHGALRSWSRKGFSPGLRLELPPNHSCYNCCLTRLVLKHIQITLLRVIPTMTCHDV